MLDIVKIRFKIPSQFNITIEDNFSLCYKSNSNFALEWEKRLT